MIEFIVILVLWLWSYELVKFLLLDQLMRINCAYLIGFTSRYYEKYVLDSSVFMVCCTALYLIKLLIDFNTILYNLLNSMIYYFSYNHVRLNNNTDVKIVS